MTIHPIANSLRRPADVVFAIVIVAVLWSGQASAQEADLKEIEHRGMTYVTAKSLKEFYRFDSYTTSKGHLFLRSQDRVVRMRSGSKDLYINNTKFVLSHHVSAGDGDLLISKLDLTKLIDPVLRPQYIRQSAPFQTVVLDAGHGGKDTGSKGSSGHEKIFTLQLTVLIKEELERRKIRVKMTRTGDDDISLPERVAYANRIGDAIFVSLHFNNGPRSPAGSKPMHCRRRARNRHSMARRRATTSACSGTTRTATTSRWRRPFTHR